MKETFFSIFQGAIDLINKSIYVIIALALFAFMWGIVKLLFSKDSAIAKSEGRSFMIYGILTLFVMTSIWGLVNILNGSIYIGDVNSSDSSISDPTQEGKFDTIEDILQQDTTQVMI